MGFSFYPRAFLFTFFLVGSHLFHPPSQHFLIISKTLSQHFAINSFPLQFHCPSYFDEKNVFFSLREKDEKIVFCAVVYESLFIFPSFSPDVEKSKWRIRALVIRRKMKLMEYFFARRSRNDFHFFFSFRNKFKNFDDKNTNGFFCFAASRIFPFTRFQRKKFCAYFAVSDLKAVGKCQRFLTDNTRKIHCLNFDRLLDNLEIW